MDIYPKFIIEDGALIIGKVKYHKELATNESNVKGGGWWILEEETKTFIFLGDSNDFGRAKIEDVQKAIDDNKVFISKHSDESIANEYNFDYNNQSEVIKLKRI
jgi:hypothetical protein